MQSLQKCAELQTDLAALKQQAAILARFDSNVRFADVLAELSYLVDSKIILTQLDIQSEPVNDSRQLQPGSGLIKVGSKTSQDEYFRFKVIIRGMACDAGNVAALICNLEKSPYFCQIMPGFSRAAKIKEQQVNEFEIECYIANYQEARQ